MSPGRTPTGCVSRPLASPASPARLRPRTKIKDPLLPCAGGRCVMLPSWLLCLAHTSSSAVLCDDQIVGCTPCMASVEGRPACCLWTRCWHQSARQHARRESMPHEAHGAHLGPSPLCRADAASLSTQAATARPSHAAPKSEPCGEPPLARQQPHGDAVPIRLARRRSKDEPQPPAAEAQMQGPPTSHRAHDVARGPQVC
jgi:hypothetical protein